MRKISGSRRGSAGTFMAGLAVAANLVGCVDADLEDGLGDELVDETTAPILNGTVTSLRPEIGILTDDLGSCTATLVDARYIVTAAHCFEYQPAVGPPVYRTGTPVNTTFTIETPSGPFTVGVDYAYSLIGSGLGTNDIAFGHLASAFPAAAGVTPAVFTTRPATGDAVSVFGYGCTDRVSRAGDGIKRYADYAYPTSAVSCPMDSGGPRLKGLHGAGGGIWGITSSYSNDTGLDNNADAAALGPIILRAVRAFGGSRGKTTPAANFAGWARTTGGKVRALPGDFDGDGIGDVALVGGNGWTSIPVAFGNANGTFTVTNRNIASFGGWAAVATNAVAADFDGDGMTDIALVGGPNFTVVPVAISGGRNSPFGLVNWTSDALLTLSRDEGAYAVAGDFNGDGKGDVAMLGGVGWDDVPLFVSTGSGLFALPTPTVATFPALARATGARAVVADFNVDGKADIALSSGSGWTRIPVAYSNGAGAFTVTNNAVGSFPAWSRAAGTKLVAGDFNGDGKGDLAVLGAAGSRTVGFAIGNGAGGFSPANLPMAGVPEAAAAARFVVTGKLDAGATTDLIITGGPGSDLPTAILKK